jgi:hypothetical protein
MEQKCNPDTRIIYMRNLSAHTDLPYEFLASLLISGVQTGEISRLGWRIRFVKRVMGRDLVFPTPASVYIAVIYVVQGLRSALSKETNSVRVSHHLIWGRKKIQFPKRCVLLCPKEYRTMEKVQFVEILSVPSSKAFGIYFLSKIDFSAVF